MSVCGIRLNMTSCAGVNATICTSSVRESTSKRSAFDFTHCNRLCRWRHLLMLSEVILKAHAAHRHSRNLSFLYIIYHKYHFFNISSICRTNEANSSSLYKRVSLTIFPSRSINTLRVIPELRKAYFAKISAPGSSPKG